MSIADIPQNPWDLSVEQTAVMEQSLVENPDDLQVRTQLLIHYMMAAFTSKEARKPHLRHVLWVIQHHPDSDLAGTPYVLLHHSPKKDVEQARTLWSQQVATFPNNARVWGHAAKFLYSLRRNKSQTQKWLQTAERLDPTDPGWPQQLGRLADSERRQQEGQQSKDAAHRALHYYERAYALTEDPEHRVLLLDPLAQNAFAIEDLAKASRYATELLNSALANEHGDQDWNHGNALHWSHIALGQVAWHQGDKEAAKEHLREAGETPGSPQLNSFGPDLVLANTLLDQGEKQAVLAYFEACARFWVMGKDRLEVWISAIQQGQTPDFDD
ncbi:MAG: hypothetical protein JWN14_4442 [Chthonomonadales bacterium]|nr:hypothetical protein [Chthonomonadales bacterium]